MSGSPPTSFPGRTRWQSCLGMLGPCHHPQCQPGRLPHLSVPLCLCSPGDAKNITPCSLFQVHTPCLVRIRASCLSLSPCRDGCYWDCNTAYHSWRGCSRYLWFLFYFSPCQGLGIEFCWPVVTVPILPTHITPACSFFFL
jgi:hypothetical protein